MSKSLSRLLAAVLASVMLFSCMSPVSVSAASSYPNTHTNTGNMASDLVSVAVSQYGYCEGSLSGNPAYASSNNYQKYGQWYDQNVDNIGVTYAPWCAAFVSWCAKEAGIPSSIVPYHAYCPYGVNWFRNRGQFKYAASRGGSYVPKQGDIVYFAPAGSSTSSHIGIVRYVSGGYVYTVEGNTSGQNGEVNDGGGVFLKSYSLSYSRLYGYGIPQYQDNTGHTITFDSNGGSEVASVNVKDGAALSAPANPTRYGFNFVGWYCNPELTDPYVFGSPVPYSFTLFAKWEEAYWGANTNLMPVDGLFVQDNYKDSGQTVWPYYNDDGSVTLYNGVSNAENHSWPSGHMNFENSFDSGNDAYIYVKYNATAQFNATVDYLDADGKAQSVKLSQLAGKGDTDFPAGYNEFFVNFGQYAYDQGHLTASDGSSHSNNIKYTKVTYYVIGGLDEYVRLYDMKLTPAFEIEDSYASLMDPDITQNDGLGSYSYDNGTLSMLSKSDSGYSVTMNTSMVVNPTDFSYLLGSIHSDVPFNISMDVVKADGTTATVEFRNEFYPLFGGLAEAPEALPAGNWSPAMDLLGYFQWNGGETAQTTVSNITVTMTGAGTLVLSNLQAGRGIVAKEINDGLSSGSGNFHVINFISNGGSDVATAYVGDGETVTRPADPTRYGYTFDGWYCNQELTDVYDFATPVPYSFNLYAKWTDWPLNHDLMPVEGKLQLDNYQGSGQYIWPYYNDDGSVTMYNGVTNEENHSWPSAYMVFENSMDVTEHAYIYVNYAASAEFNAQIEYLDPDGNPHTVMLSELAGIGTADFPAGTHEIYADFGTYLLQQGHIPESLAPKYSKVTYFVVGGLDEYVRIYDMKFTNAYTVSFNSNGGSAVHHAAVPAGGTVSAPAEPTRYGYKFLGWYANKALTDLYDFSTPVPYSFTLYAKWEQTEVPVYPGGMAGDGTIYAEGLDVSVWNGDGFNFQAVKDAGYDYVIIRCGSTNLGEDVRFEAYYQAARAAGLDIGAYFYSYATTVEGAVSDANKCLSYIQGKTFEYPIYFDYEDGSQGSLTQAQSTDICLAFMDTVAAQGYLVGMYSYESRLSTLDMATLGSYYEVWVANYKDNTHETLDPTYCNKYGMYQYTDKQYAGSVGPFDANVCYKDYPSIVKTYGFNGYTANGSAVKYLPACDASAVSLIDALVSVGEENVNAEYQMRLAIANGYTDYAYTADQNNAMLALLKQGKLIDPEGTILTGWQTLTGGNRYYYDANGERQYGWLTVDGNTYYLNATTGAMVSGIQQIDGIYYTFGSDGALTGKTRISLVGSWNVWDQSVNVMTGEGTLVTTTVELEGGNYPFKIVLDGTIWYGNNGTIADTTEATSAIGWEMSTDAGDCILAASGGTYTFSFNTETKFLVVTHTPVEEPKPTGKVEPKSATLSLEDEVLINLYFLVEEMEVTPENVGMLIYNEMPETADVATADTVIEGGMYNESNGRYMVSTPGIPGQYLADSLYLVAYAKDANGNYVYARTVEYSGKKYCTSQMTKGTEELKATCVALMNYGAAAQQYFAATTDYTYETLMNEEFAQYQDLVVDYSEDLLAARQSVSATKAGTLGTEKNGFTKRSVSMSADGDFSLNYYFTTDKAADKVTFYYWTADQYSSVETLTLENASGSKEMVLTDTANRYWANFAGIAAKDIDKTVFACGVYEVDGVTYSTGVFSYSIGYYCTSKAAGTDETVKPFAKAIAVYSYHARIFLESMA